MQEPYHHYYHLRAAACLVTTFTAQMISYPVYVTYIANFQYYYFYSVVSMELRKSLFVILWSKIKKGQFE